MSTTVYGPYSPVCKAGDFYYVSGQLGVDGETKKAPAALVDQAHLLFKNLQELLSENQLTLNDIVKTTVFVTNIDDFKTVNKIYVSYFKQPRPARSCVEVSNLPKVTSNNATVLIEMEAVAYKTNTVISNQLNNGSVK
jgi:2-iminobutanoate/2-iminopropanoate deaminase